MDTQDFLDELGLKFYGQQREKDFKLKKENIHCRLSGDNKYYNANQCYVFGENVKLNGWNRYQPNEIDSVYFTKHSVTIRLTSRGETDVKRFVTAKEMFAWVEGYNECMFQVEREGTPRTIITN